MDATVNGVSFSLDDAGRGEPLLFVHGFPLDRRMWRAQLDEFSKEHRVIVPDLRGFGGSGCEPAATSMSDYADDLAALLDVLEVDVPITLCGLSMGGYIAFAFFRKHRHRVGRLILCDTKAAADSPEKRAEREQTAEDVLRHGTLQLAKTMPGGLLAASTPLEQPNVIVQIGEMITKAPPAGIAAALRAMADRPEATDLLPQIDVPTLVLCGESDRISPPEEMKSIASRIPKSRFVIIPAAGHLAPMENPRRVNDEIRRFLDEG